MTISARPIAFFADFRRLRVLRWILAAAVLAAMVGAPDVADAASRARRAAVMGGGYDGYWNVLIITQAGPCDQTYSFPFQISGGRISSSGIADVTGRVGRGGGVAVRVSAGGSVATGSGRLGRQHRRRPLDGQGSVGGLQRPLAGHAGLTIVCKRKWPARSSGGPYSKIHKREWLLRISAAPEPSPPDGLRNARPARPSRSPRRRS